MLALAAVGAVGIGHGTARGQTLDTAHFSQEPMPWECGPILTDHTIGCGKACLMRSIYEQQIRAGMDPRLVGPSTPIGPGSFARRGDRGPGGEGSPPASPTDVLSYDLSLEVAPPSAALSGTNVMTVRSLFNNLTTFTFMLRWNYTITSCTITDGQGTYSVSPSVPVAGGTTYARTFTLQRPVNTGETFTVTVSYSGNIQTGIGFSPGSVVNRPQNNATGEPPVLCTLSQPYYAATWWPSKDGDIRLPGDNLDKATMRVAITTPSSMQALSVGVLEGVDDLSGDRKRYRWSTNYQTPSYLLFISVSQYTQWQQTYSWSAGEEYPGGPQIAAGSMPVHFSIYPSFDSPSNRSAWEQCIVMMDALRPVFGVYPFRNEKYGKYQFEFSGGMEHQTYSGQGGPGGTAFGLSLSAHELGHQWWGDHVTCRTWNDIWLNEGFASYSEALWEERRPGSSGAAALRSAMQTRKPGNPANSVYVDDVTSLARIFDFNGSYRKGGWVLHMLRRIVGEQTFVRTLGNFRAQYGGSAATTAEFIALASSTAGQDLSWFFTPWVFGNGAPNYSFGWQNTTVNGQRYLRLHIAQSNSTGNAARFDMPMDVRVTTTSGVQNFVVRQDATTDWYLLPLAAAATGVELDPDGWVLNYALTEGAYLAGPPKVVSISPAPGSSIPPSPSPTNIAIGFSAGVSSLASDYVVTRATTGAAVPVSVSYDTGTLTATLSASQPLAPGVYNVLVSDRINAGGIVLDGELVGPAATSLPSGDGTPGGSVMYSFTVQAGLCRADIDGDGVLTVQDIFDFLTAWFAGTPQGDFDSSGTLTAVDIFDFLSAWFAGC
jgi:aminopeptidase N